MSTIVAIGELLWDMLPDRRLLGGAPANFAFRLQELGNNVALVSRLGKDDLGDEAILELSKAGLDHTYIQRDYDYPTGTVDVFFDEFKNPDYYITPNVAYDFMEVDQRLVDMLDSVDCMAFGTLAQRSARSKATIQQLIRSSGQCIKFCDINLRKACYTSGSIATSMEMADIVKVNQQELNELAVIFDIAEPDQLDIASRLIDQFSLNICLVTYEHHGAIAVNRKKEGYYSPGYEVDLEDSLGSGDAFSAAFIHHHLIGRSLYESLDAGNLNGARVAMQKGAMQRMDISTENSIDMSRSKRSIKQEFAEYMSDSMESRTNRKL